MVQQVTNGIKISVTSNFEGTSYRNFRLYFAFSYEVT
ncbi:MAG: Co2+/Mg2+ efflux protein ApaG, partial [Lutibacter sp.]|nr:Co2+/Mg2+ efflux protein ApaG [Lutibacter sp.]